MGMMSWPWPCHLFWTSSDSSINSGDSNVKTKQNKSSTEKTCYHGIIAKQRKKLPFWNTYVHFPHSLCHFIFLPILLDTNNRILFVIAREKLTEADGNQILQTEAISLMTEWIETQTLDYTAYVLCPILYFFYCS